MAMSSCTTYWYFNSQPHKEADQKSGLPYSHFRHFNSQPHKEADGIGKEYYDSHAISTHSLTRRLTGVILWQVSL